MGWAISHTLSELEERGHRLQPSFSQVSLDVSWSLGVSSVICSTPRTNSIFRTLGPSSAFFSMNNSLTFCKVINVSRMLWSRIACVAILPS